MRSWHHTIHYKTKVKTGEYSHGDNQPKLGEVELVLKIPMMEKESAENIAKVIMGQLLNPKHIGDIKIQSTEMKPWTLNPEVESDVLDFFEKKVVG
tara:strand:- start:223 stop:510 length:288 start_codon:yes stop_codon:yes gene_type:complete